MQRSQLRYVRVGVAALLSTVVLVVYVLSPLPQWLSVKSLERQVKRNVDPTELQQWATNLLAQHRSYDDFSGTNLPSGLKKVKGFGQSVKVIPLNPTNPEVWIFCDGKGSPFLVVGSPSLGTQNSPNIIPWQLGIYFAYDSDWR